MNKLASFPPELTPAEPYQDKSRSIPSQTGEETPEFVEYWRAIMLRKWSILALACVVSVVAYLWVSQTVPVYQSSAIILVETDTPKLVPMRDEDNRSNSYYREYFQTQAEVLKSRAVAQRVITKLDLAEHPEFDPRQDKPSAIKKWSNEHFPTLAALLWKPVSAFDEASLEEQLLKRFAERLSVDPVRQTQLIKISFEAHDATIAAAAANATAQAYIQADLDARYTTNETTEQLIGQQLADLKAQLGASEAALQAYRDQEGMLDSKSTILGGTGKQLDELTQKLVEARVRRSEAEQVYNQVKAGAATNFASLPAVVKSDSVQRAREVEAEAEKKLAEISQRLGPGHPNFVAARSDLSAAQATTQSRIQNLVASVAKEYAAARATEKAIEGALAQSKGTIQNLNRKDIQLGVLEREAATNRELYQTFLSRSRENRATKDTQGLNARLVDRAVAVSLPIRPAKTRTVAIAAFLSLLLGTAIALLAKALNNGVKTSEDVEKKLHQPFLAALPVLTGKDKKNAARAALDHPQNLYAESVRTALTGVLLSALDAPRKIIVVTSSVAEEGKSTFAINLAFSQSKTKKVLLIEGDMRRPCFSKVMNFSSERKGLSQLLSGAGTFDECLLRIKGTNLHVIPAGAIPSNPMELLVSGKFHDVLTMLHDRCDVVIIDSPPVQLVSDALVIARQSTGVIYLVKADDTPAELAQAGIKRIAAANIPIFGVVLNQQDFKKAEKYYGECFSSYGKYAYGTAYGAEVSGGGPFKSLKYWARQGHLTDLGGTKDAATQKKIQNSTRVGSG